MMREAKTALERQQRQVRTQALDLADADLLARALRAPAGAGQGDCRARPCGTPRTRGTADRLDPARGTAAPRQDPARAWSCPRPPDPTSSSAWGGLPLSIARSTSRCSGRMTARQELAARLPSATLLAAAPQPASRGVREAVLSWRLRSALLGGCRRLGRASPRRGLLGARLARRAASVGAPRRRGSARALVVRARVVFLAGAVPRGRPPERLLGRLSCGRRASPPSSSSRAACAPALPVQRPELRRRPGVGQLRRTSTSRRRRLLARQLGAQHLLELGRNLRPRLADDERGSL